MINVLFTGRELRQRRRETISNPPEGVIYHTLVSINAMKPDYYISQTTTKQLSSFIKIIKFLVSLLELPNIQYIRKKYLKNIDIVHTPGHLLFNRKKYVVEIDNPYCLSRYSAKVFFKRKKIIAKFLKSKYCVAIICISEAAKKSMEFYFDNEIIKKCYVVYPHVKINDYKKINNLDKIILLSCNTKFYMKGTREILSAFELLNKKYNNLELWIVSNTPKEYIDKYSNMNNIKFFSAKYNKEQLYKDFYSQCDIFIQISYQDSFGLVYLELMASGKPIITTDIYAIPELIEDFYNGFLVKSPIYMYNNDYSLKQEYFPIKCKDTEEDFYKQINGNETVSSIVKSCSILIDNKDLREKMSQNSIEIIENKFSEQMRKNQLLKVYNKIYENEKN